MADGSFSSKQQLTSTTSNSSKEKKDDMAKIARQPRVLRRPERKQYSSGRDFGSYLTQHIGWESASLDAVFRERQAEIEERFRRSKQMTTKLWLQDLSKQQASKQASKQTNKQTDKKK